MKEKIKSYEFWVSIVSAVMVVLQSLSLKFNLPYVQEIVMGFLGILAVAGIVKKSDPPSGDENMHTTDKDKLMEDVNSPMQEAQNEDN